MCSPSPRRPGSRPRRTSMLRRRLPPPLHPDRRRCFTPLNLPSARLRR
jgi:hypothetical protein